MTDIISEASLVSRSYPYGWVVTISGASAKEANRKIILTNIPNFNFEEKLVYSPPPEDESNVIPVQVNKKPTTTIFLRRENGSYIKLIGTLDGVESLLNHVNKFNEGPIVEAIIAAAIFAKFTARGDDGVKNISVSDVINSVRKLQADSTNSANFSTTVHNRNSQISDIISLQVKIPRPSFIALMNPELDEVFHNYYNSAVTYVNSRNATRYSRYFFENGKVDKLTIECDGVSYNVDHKWDVRVKVETNNKKPFYIDNLNLSIKADTNRYSQASPGQEEHGPEDWHQRLYNFFHEHFGLGITVPTQRFYDLESYTRLVFAQVANNINQMFQGATPEQEAKFILDVSNGLRYHVTSDKGYMIHIPKGKELTLHDFKRLSLSLQTVKLSAVVSAPNKRPSIEIQGPTGSLLFKVRFTKSSDINSGRATLILEMGPLLKQLTQVNYNKAPRSSDIANQPNQSVEPNPLSEIVDVYRRLSRKY